MKPKYRKNESIFRFHYDDEVAPKNLFVTKRHVYDTLAIFIIQYNS